MSLKKKSNKYIQFLFKHSLYETINGIIDKDLSKELSDYQNSYYYNLYWFIYVGFTNWYLKQENKLVVTDKMIELYHKNELDEFITDKLRYTTQLKINFKDIELTKNQYKVFIEKLNDLMDIKVDREWRKYFNWKRWELRFRKGRDDNNLNGVIIQYLVNQCKPMSVWKDVVYLGVWKRDYITKTELHQFQNQISYITTEFNELIKKNVNIQIKSMYRGNEWWSNNERYWKCVEIFKEYFHTTT